MDLSTEEGILSRAILLLLVRPFSGITSSRTNSTWIRPGGMTSEVPLEVLLDIYLRRFRRYYETFYSPISDVGTSKITFSHGLADEVIGEVKADTIFTSPPFPNRYDYGVMYAPELDFLSKVLPHWRYSNVADKLLATNRVRSYTSVVDDIAWIESRSTKTFKFLLSVRKSAPSDESDYYLKYFTQYYRGLFRFVSRAVDALPSNGRLFMALQNNIHRGTLNEIARFVADYCREQGLAVGIGPTWKVAHQGKRNISSKRPLLLHSQKEQIVRIQSK